jgi:hypothetical protein
MQLLNWVGVEERGIWKVRGLGDEDGVGGRQKGVGMER